jgi:alkylhydroperoxidase family enzyme
MSTRYFQELIGTPQTRTSTLNFDSLTFPAVDLTGLEQEFSETEIWDAIKAMSQINLQALTASPCASSKFVGPWLNLR